jgi:hypothetical protein
MIGQMVSTPPPKAMISIGLRPSLSDNQPATGCISMKAIRLAR